MITPTHRSPRSFGGAWTTGGRLFNLSARGTIQFGVENHVCAVKQKNGDDNGLLYNLFKLKGYDSLAAHAQLSSSATLCQLHTLGWMDLSVWSSGLGL